MDPPSQVYLFGGKKPWNPLDWTSSDDRVRGGSSYSTLTCSPFAPTAKFHGYLDIKTLGGAGFASQRTTREHQTWDLSGFDGLELNIERSDGKKYTVALKDELLPKRSDGREQSTVSWECDFKVEEGNGKGKVFVKWEDLKATYRGREKKDAKPLDLKNVRRLSLMMRSFFGTQEGEFSLSILSISAINLVSDSNPGAFSEPYRDHPNNDLNENTVFRPSITQEDNNAISTSTEQDSSGWLF